MNRIPAWFLNWLRGLLLLCALVLGTVVMFGTPHIGADYVCRHERRGGQPCQSYDYCAYYGFQGRRLVFPVWGERCLLIKWLRVDWNQLLKPEPPEKPRW
ncbi:MAG: hypothetical protein KDK04_19545 [Candidatus Competibacteraceae bacterium]|nr:hypothetical protein [Candidatus Competibacteraceae bacterium]